MLHGQRFDLVRSQHYQTEMGSPRDRFGATVSVELGEDWRNMELGGVDRDSWPRAITLLEAPSAMAASTSCSRGVSETRLAPSSRSVACV
jgi:hypothetical protein